MNFLETVSGKSFEVEFASPSPITENVIFYAKILNSDVDTVHETFRNSEETTRLVYIFDETVLAVYEGYTRYGGFTINFDNSITVKLSKNI